MTMTHRRVLVDTTGPIKMQVVEGQDGGKLIVAGKVGHTDRATANGRVYPRSVMEREIGRLTPRIAMGGVIGAVDHPGDGKSRIRDGGCITRELRIEDDGTIFGKFEVVEDAPAGQALAAFLRRGAAIGMSSRGIGSTALGPKGDQIVGEDFRLAAFDFVADPACHDAFPQVFSEDVDPETITEDVIRAKFPEIVRSIEERSYDAAQATCEADMRDKVEERTKDKLKESEAKLRKEMTEDFAAKLVRAIAEMRTSVEEEVRSDFASDPEVAGAKLALKKIAEMVSPFNPTPEMQTVIAEREAVEEELKKTINGLEEELAGNRSKLAKLTDKGRSLAFSLYVERTLQGRPDADAIREMLGDIESVTDADELKTRLESAIEKANQMRADVEEQVQQEAEELRAKLEEAEERIKQAEQSERKLRASISEQIGSFETRITNEMNKKNALLTEAAEKIEELEQRAKQAASKNGKKRLMGYAKDRLVGHPHRRAIIEAVRGGEIDSKDEIDELAEEHEDQAMEPGGVNERIRRALGRGREALFEEERVEEEQVTEDHGGPDLSFLGTTMNEQKALAGINRQHRR